MSSAIIPPFRLAIIGGGAAGLISCKVAKDVLGRRLAAQFARSSRSGHQYLAEPDNLPEPDIVVFEKRDRLHGLWHYDKPFGQLADAGQAVNALSEQPRRLLPRTNGSSCGPMYAGLHCNLPSRLMEVPGDPFMVGGVGVDLLDEPSDGSSSSFAHHSAVLDYLRRFARRHRLLPHVRFNTAVRSVEVVAGSRDAWSSGSRGAVAGASSSSAGEDQDSLVAREKQHRSYHFLLNGNGEERFDAVVCAGGHFDTPNMPESAGRLLLSERTAPFAPSSSAPPSPASTPPLRLRVSHSKDFDTDPGAFADVHTAVVLGAGSSARDIVAFLRGRVRCVVWAGSAVRRKYLNGGGRRGKERGGGAGEKIGVELELGVGGHGGVDDAEGGNSRNLSGATEQKIQQWMGTGLGEHVGGGVLGETGAVGAEAKSRHGARDEARCVVEGTWSSSADQDLSASTFFHDRALDETGMVEWFDRGGTRLTLTEETDLRRILEPLVADMEQLSTQSTEVNTVGSMQQGINVNPSDEEADKTDADGSDGAGSPVNRSSCDLRAARVLHVICATGYQYDLQFLAPELRPAGFGGKDEIDGHQQPSLDFGYRHPKYSRLGFVGLAPVAVPLPSFYYQALHFCRTLSLGRDEASDALDVPSRPRRSGNRCFDEIGFRCFDEIGFRDLFDLGIVGRAAQSTEEEIRRVQVAAKIFDFAESRIRRNFLTYRDHHYAIEWGNVR